MLSTEDTINEKRCISASLAEDFTTQVCPTSVNRCDHFSTILEMKLSHDALLHLQNMTNVQFNGSVNVPYSFPLFRYRRTTMNYKIQTPEDCELLTFTVGDHHTSNFS